MPIILPYDVEPVFFEMMMMMFPTLMINHIAAMSLIVLELPFGPFGEREPTQNYRSHLTDTLPLKDSKLE